MTPWRLVTTPLFLLLATASALPRSFFDPEAIIFPDELPQLFGCSAGASAEPILRDVVNLRRGGVQECNSMLGDVLWPETGECVKLLTQGPCPPGQWVKLAISTFLPLCEDRPCDDEGAFMDGGCHSLADTTMCPDTQQLFVNEFGQGECDCIPGTVYYDPTKTCYTPYTQGPCQSGHIIKVVSSDGTGHAACVPNPCPSDSMVPLDRQCHIQTRSGDGISCFNINTPGPCAEGELVIDNTLNEPVCLQTETHSIINLPNTKRCPLGSIRDFTGRCRRAFRRIFQRQPVVSSRPGLQPDGKGLCGPGFELLGGICYRLG